MRLGSKIGAKLLTVSLCSVKLGERSAKYMSRDFKYSLGPLQALIYFIIMYNLCVFTCIIVMFVFHCTHVRMSYVLNFCLLTYLLTYGAGRCAG